VRGFARWLAWPLGIAALVVAQDVAVSWLSGAPARAWGLVPLSTMRLASFLALALGLALASWVCAVGWSAAARARNGAVAALALAVFLGNGRYIGSEDAAATRLIPFALGRAARPCFEDSALLAFERAALPYWFVPAGPHVVSRYPIASGVLALPAYLPAIVGSYDPTRERVHELERIAAAALAAFGVLIVLAIARRWLPESSAWLATAVYALGTNVATVLSKALWQHTGGAFGFALALAGLFLVKGRVGAGALAGLGLGLAVAARSTNLVPAAFVWLALGVAHGRPALLLSAASAALPIAAQAAYSAYYFGSPLGHGYGAEASEGWRSLWLEGVAGLLLSPSRGLLVYSPCLVFAALALARPAVGQLAARAASSEPAPVDARVTRLLLAAIGSAVLVMGKWWCWWGGGSPGERMTADITPLWGVGLALAFGRFGAQARGGRLLIAASLYACVLHALIVYVRPSAYALEHFYRVLHGPWNWRAFAPLAYWLG
jgi:hypothetical protein